jgi:predicted ArsR family transcriptional regulator
MKPTRQRLLDYLASHPPATAAVLARALQVTPADVRHHLAILRREGWVIAAGNPPPGGRGRPALRYTLASQPGSSGLADLVAALLAEVLEDLALPVQEAALRRLAARLAGPPVPAAGLSQRLVFAVQRLDQLGYHARWEARAAGPRLILEGRPFASLETTHPELARLEAYLIETLLGVPMSRFEVSRSLAMKESGANYQVVHQPRTPLN